MTREWLVEPGQNAAPYQSRKADNEKRACQVVDWYRQKYPIADRPAMACVPYPTRQQDFCVDPKAEAVSEQEAQPARGLAMIAGP